MEQINEETIFEIQKCITPQLQPTRATKSGSLSPMLKKSLKSIKVQIQAQQEIPSLNLKKLNNRQKQSSLTHIETSRTNSKDQSSRKYLNPAYQNDPTVSYTTRNSYSNLHNSIKQQNWQEAYSPSETFTKLAMRNFNSKQAFPSVTQRSSSQKGIDHQYASLNFIRSTHDIPNTAREDNSDQERRKGSYQQNIRIFRRLGSQPDISKYTAQSNSQIIQSLNYLDEFESRNIFKDIKVGDQKIQNADFLKDLFKEVYQEYQTIRLGQKLHLQLYFGETKLVKIKTIDKNFPIILRNFVNSGHFTIYLTKKYRQNQPPDHFLHDYIIQQTEKSIVLYDGLSPSEEIKYIFMNITSQTNCDFEFIAQTQKLKEDFISSKGSLRNIKNKGFIQFPTNEKVFMQEIGTFYLS